MKLSVVRSSEMKSVLGKQKGDEGRPFHDLKDGRRGGRGGRVDGEGVRRVAAVLEGERRDGRGWNKAIDRRLSSPFFFSSSFRYNCANIALMAPTTLDYDST
jgi:hypothetical protein